MDLRKRLPLMCPKCNQRELVEGGHGLAGPRYGNIKTGTGTVKINVLVFCVGKTCDGFYGYVPFDLTVNSDSQVIEENSFLDKLYIEQLSNE